MPTLYKTTSNSHVIETSTTPLVVVPTELTAEHVYCPSSVAAAEKMVSEGERVVPPEYLEGLDLGLILPPPTLLQYKSVMSGLADTEQERRSVEPDVELSGTVETVISGRSEGRNIEVENAVVETIIVGTF